MKRLTTDEWVARLNRLAREMEAVEDTMHPSVWAEQNADLMDKWKKLAVQPTYDPPTQMQLGTD